MRMTRPGYIASGLVLLYTVMCGVEVQAVCNTEPTVFDCDNYNPFLCPRDSRPFCLTNGTKVSGSCEAMRAVCVEHACLDNTNLACDPPATTAEDPCVRYIATGRCTHDLFPYCLTNGTMVYGTCSALQAVCHEHASIDKSGLLCTEETTDECVMYNATGRCTHDLRPYCLTNGTMVLGTCRALKAVCHEDAHIDETKQLCPTISELSDVDCVSYNNTGNCHLLDHIPFCLKNGTVVYGTCAAHKAVCHDHVAIDDTEEMCQAETTDECVIYNATGRCTHDLRPYCLTNGTTVYGTCSALQAVCHERAHIAVCPEENTEDPCVSYIATGRCTHDLLPFCLSNGTRVFGTCSALQAVCHEHAHIDKSGLLCPGETTNDACNNYNATSSCTHDLLPFCLSNGTMVFGTCSALKAVCHEHAHIDQTGHLCPGENTEIDCVSYIATGRCTHDLIPHCLTNGTTVFGQCSLLKAVCHEHAHIDSTGHLCPGENTEDPCVSYIATGRCTHDLLPFCLSNGTMVFGTCSALQAVCHEHASIDKTGLLCPGKTTEDACVNYNATNSCTHDLLPFCLSNGTMVFGTCSALKAVCHEHAHIDQTGHLCPGENTEIDCVSYIATGRCTHDLIPHCLTNGTTVFGQCSLLKAVCHEHAHIDSTGHLCPGENTEDPCVSYIATGRCTHDLLPFCLSNGTMVFGTCSALQAVCHEHASIDKTGLLCPGKTTEDACNNYNATNSCTHDLLPFCLSNGTMVFGTCSALKAVCHEHAHIDNTGHLCPGENTEIDCVSYNASGRCTHDLIPHCLTNGSTVFGTCSLLKAVCHEHATARSCDSSAATSLLMSTFDVVTVIAVCVIAWSMMK